MKPIHLNLATRPYRDVAPMLSAVVVLAVITALLMINNAQAAYRYLVNTKETRAEITRVQAEAAKQEEAAAKLEESISKIDVKTLNLETRYINGQIADRAFSWSELLDRLEAVTPRNVRLVDVNPTVDVKTGDVKLSIRATAKSHDAFVNYLSALLADPNFDRPFPQSEAIREDGTHEISLNAIYLPSQSLSGVRAVREVAR